MCLSYSVAYIVQEVYVLYIKWNYFKDYSANLWAKESFQEWGKFIKLAIPTTTLTCIEWWAFEVAIILAGLIGVD